MTLRHRILPDARRAGLKTLLAQDGAIRLIEAHNGLSAIIGNNASVTLNDTKLEFDGLWISSFTCAAAKGLPDAELSTGARRIETIDEIMNVTDKPVIVDGDTGGDSVNFEYLCSKLEMLGVSGIIIEDKIIPKRNSLSTDSRQLLEDPQVFAQKIIRGRKALQSDDFLIFARIESLIANAGLDDALHRARTYLLADVDGIFIHSKHNTPDEVYDFLQGYEEICHELGFRRPVAAVPTAYSDVTCTELLNRGIKIVIYANHLLRAAHLAMSAVCKQILESDRSFEANGFCSPVPTIFDLVGFSDVLKRDDDELRQLERQASDNDTLLKTQQYE